MGMNPTGPIPGQADPNAAAGPFQELKIDPVKLPDGFTPPPVKSEIMELDDPLLQKDELDKLRKDLSKYQQVLRNARASSDADKALLKMGLKYRLGMMCLKENRQQLAKNHEDLLKELNSIASAPELNASTVKSFRQLVLQELLSQASPLLTTQNFYVRLHIALLIGELNLTEESARQGLKLEAFTPGLEELIKVITDDMQPDAVKVVAVNGIVRLMKLGNPPFPLRTAVAQALVSQMGLKTGHPWYQMRLAGALSIVDVNTDQAGKPFVVNVLTSVLADPARTFAVRAEAAKSLGRVPLPSSVKASDVTQAVAAFALQLAKAAQQSPQQKDDPRWKGEFIRVYLAFQQLDANDLLADKKSKAGLLNNSQAAAKPAYDLIVPLVAAILHGKRLTVPQVQSLEGWVAGQTPNGAKSPSEPKSTEPVTVGGRP